MVLLCKDCATPGWYVPVSMEELQTHMVPRQHPKVLVLVSRCVKLSG